MLAAIYDGGTRTQGCLFGSGPTSMRRRKFRRDCRGARGSAASASLWVGANQSPRLRFARCPQPWSAGATALMPMPFGSSRCPGPALARQAALSGVSQPELEKHALMKSDPRVAVLRSVQQPRQTLPMIAAAGSFLPRGRDFVGRSRLSACLTTAGRPRRLR